MQRDLRPPLLALLCVLAVALGAATLESTTSPALGDVGTGSGGVGGGNNSSTSSGQNQSGSPVSSSSQQLDPPGICVPFLRTDAFAGLLALVALLVGVVLYRRGGAPYVAAGFAVSLMPSLFGYVMLTDCVATIPRGSGSASSSSASNGSVLSGAAGSGPEGSAPGVTPVTVAVLGLLVVAVAVVLVRATGNAHDPAAEAAAEHDVGAEPEEALTAVGVAAGEAADRIDAEDDIENEVFRAWREMTSHLDVPNPAASTPAEFAEAARDAEMESDDVDALTDLFREVRYGGEQPTPDREERAVDALRAIEEAYADTGGEDDR